MHTPAVPAPGCLARFAPEPRLSTALRLHEDGFEHYHDLSEEGRGALAEMLWKIENVELTTVGIDIGSSTSHLMFARVHLQRKTQLLSSQFVVVSREILWRSPILLTPFLPDYTIDAERLRTFIDEAYRGAGVKPEQVDSGAVILTGEAIKRSNAEAIARLFAADAGKFVCASAGHHMECVLAAQGSGAVALSRRTHRTVLNVDIGGGTTKFALIRNGEIVSTSAVAVGGRLVAHDAQGRWTRIEEPARVAAAALGVDLALGAPSRPRETERLVDALAEVVVAAIRGEAPEGLGRELLLTDPPARVDRPELVTFTGGVSEYIFGREAATFGDIARPLAEKIVRAFSAGRIPAERLDPGQGIRATVIGASQFSVQVSGKTIHLTEGVGLPVRNVPVLFPAIERCGDFEAQAVAAAVREALGRIEAHQEQPIALGIRWHGDPHYHRLRALAQGIAAAADGPARLPLILLVDGDVGKLLGHILEHELKVVRSVISIDGLQLREFDYVDIGEVMEPAHVVAVVIKSLLFPSH